MEERDAGLKRESVRKQRENGNQLKWQRENTDKIKTYQLKRQSKTHEFSEKEWGLCKKYFNYSCAYCGMSEKESLKKFDERLHKDHVVHDGSNKLDNCVPACKGCNSSKYNFEMIDWFESRDFFKQENLDKINDWLEFDYKNFVVK